MAMRQLRPLAPGCGGKVMIIIYWVLYSSLYILHPFADIAASHSVNHLAEIVALYKLAFTLHLYIHTYIEREHIMVA